MPGKTPKKGTRSSLLTPVPQSNLTGTTFCQGHTLHYYSLWLDSKNPTVSNHNAMPLTDIGVVNPIQIARRLPPETICFDVTFEVKIKAFVDGKETWWKPYQVGKQHTGTYIISRGYTFHKGSTLPEGAIAISRNKWHASNLELRGYLLIPRWGTIYALPYWRKSTPYNYGPDFEERVIRLPVKK